MRLLIYAGSDRGRQGLVMPLLALPHEETVKSETRNGQDSNQKQEAERPVGKIMAHEPNIGAPVSTVK